MKKILIALAMLMPVTTIVACSKDDVQEKQVVLPELRGKTLEEVKASLDSLSIKYLVNGTGLFSHYGNSLKAGDTVSTANAIRLFFSNDVVVDDENNNGTGGEDNLTPGETSYPSLAVTPANIMVKYIDIGATGSSAQGESAYIKIGNIDILVDGGETQENAQVITETLRGHMTDNTIEYLVSSHDHNDHMGGYQYFLQGFDVHTAFESNYMRSSLAFISSYRNIMNAKENVTICKFTDALASSKTGCHKVYNIAPDVSITFLSTGSETKSDSNHSSVVFVLEAYGTKFLFNGDSEKDQESVYAPQAGKVHFLKAGHHGTRNGNSVYLMQQTQPDNFIVTNGTILNNANGHPTDTAINNVYQVNNKTNIYATTGGCGTSGNNASNCTSFIDKSFQRNGDITVNVTSTGYTKEGSLTGENLVELSQTNFWRYHPKRQYKHYLAGY